MTPRVTSRDWRGSEASELGAEGDPRVDAFVLVSLRFLEYSRGVHLTDKFRDSDILGVTVRGSVNSCDCWGSRCVLQAQATSSRTKSRGSRKFQGSGRVRELDLVRFGLRREEQWKGTFSTEFH